MTDETKPLDVDPIPPGRGNRVSRAVVFANHAFVTREVEAKAEAGPNRFLVQTLARSIDSLSVQASVRARGEILGVQYRELPTGRDISRDVRDLEDRLEALEIKSKRVKRDRLHLERQSRFLDSIVDLSRDQLPREMVTQFPTADRLRATAEFLDSGYAGLTERETALDEQAHQVEQEIAVVRRRLKKLRKPGGRTRRCIEILFNSEGAQEVSIEASYVAEHAGWKPVYKAEVAGDFSGLRLKMLASIEQDTGEDWEDVRLTVSNAVPMQGTELPEPEAWTIDLNRPAPTPMPMLAALSAGGPAAPAGGAPSDDDDLDDLMGAVETFEDEAVAETQDEAEFAAAESREVALAFEYDLPQVIAIESGGGENVVPLRMYETESDFFLQCIPARDPRAYLVCRARADRALLPGRMNVHLGGRFVGGTELGEKRPGEDLLVNLGVDRGVRVRRERLVNKKTETFFGVADRSTVARELVYCIALESMRDTPARVRVLDAVPVSLTDRVTIKGLELKPEPTHRDWKDKEGVMAWEMDLAPGETREIRIRFFVKHPRDRRPEGL